MSLYKDTIIKGWNAWMSENPSEDEQIEVVNRMSYYEPIIELDIDVGEYITSNRAREIYYKNRKVCKVMR
jgi:hypothetical protein